MDHLYTNAPVEIIGRFGFYISIPEDKLSSCPLQSNSTFFANRVPESALGLTPDEWALIMGALSAYQHNQTYRPLYEKLSTQTAKVCSRERPV